MKRIISSLLLLAFGVMLALNSGGVHSRLLVWSTRNPISIAVNSFIYENAPTAMYRFEQDLLVHFSLGPYFLFVGILAGVSLSLRNSVWGVLLPVGFAASWCILLFRAPIKWAAFNLRWSDFLPDMIAAWCLVPIYLTGIGLGQLLRRRRYPQWRIVDCLAAMTVACLMCYAAVNRPFALIPSIFLLSFGLLAWRMLAGRFGAKSKTCEQTNAADVRNGVAQHGESTAARG